MTRRGRRSRRQIGEPDVPRGRSIAPGRQTQPKWGSYFGMLPYTGIPRRRYEAYDLTRLEYSKMPASFLLTLLPDLSPDVSLALWNMLRLGSSGFCYTVKDSQGQDDSTGKDLLDAKIERLGRTAGGLNGLIVQWLQSGYLLGAVAGEAALTEGLNDIDDFYPVDPYAIIFGRDENNNLVPKFQPWTGGAPIALNTDRFWYIPIDPQIDDPYGRAPAAPVLQEVWFDISVISDLRKVVHNQGWPRIDIKVLEEAIVNSAPPAVKNDPEKLNEWLNDRISDVQAAYNDLKPDDSFVHYDSVEIGNSDASGKLFDADRVMRVIERRMIKALKQLPVLMASNEGTTETHGTVQWRIFVAGLESLRQPIQFILSRMLQFTLQVLGHPGRVECWFEQISTTDRLADATASSVEIKNALMKWAAGWQTWEESSIEITGSAPPEGTAEPDPAVLAGVAASDASQQDTQNRRIDAELRLLGGDDEEEL